MTQLIIDLESYPIDAAGSFLEPVAAPSNYKDPEKIAAYIKEAEAEQLNRAALDLDLARIVCIGTANKDGAALHVDICKTEDDEREALRSLALVLKDMELSLITFAGARFDLPLLLRRYMYLGLPVPYINLERFKTPHVDLYEKLTLNGQVKAHGLRWYANRLNWLDLLQQDPLAGGVEVGQAIAEGRWEDVQKHCEVDVQVTARLAKWMGIVR